MGGERGTNGGRMEHERGSLFLFYFSCAPTTCNYSSPRVYNQQPAEAHCTQKRSRCVQLHKNSRRVITSDCAMRVIKTIVENMNRSRTGHERELNGARMGVERERPFRSIGHSWEVFIDVNCTLHSERYCKYISGEELVSPASAVLWTTCQFWARVWIFEPYSAPF